MAIELSEEARQAALVAVTEQHHYDMAEWFIRCEGWAGWVARDADEWYEAMNVIMKERAPA